MSSQEKVRELLRSQWVKSKGKNPSLSLRKFAKMRGLSFSSVAQILNSDRNITHKMAAKILLALGEEPSDLVEKVQIENHSQPRQKIRKFTMLENDQFFIAGQWYYFAIINLVETNNFKSDSKWIAKRLGLDVQCVEGALERLIRAELLIRNSQGKILSTGSQFTSGTGSSNTARRQHNFQNLELAREALSNVPLEKRDFTHVTMAIDPRLIPEAKNRIDHFVESLAAFLESGEKSEVYKMCLQLFPITKEE